MNRPTESSIALEQAAHATGQYFKKNKKREKKNKSWRKYFADDSEADAALVRYSLCAVAMAFIFTTLIVSSVTYSKVMDMKDLIKEQSILISTLASSNCPNGSFKTERFGCLGTVDHYKLCHEHGGQLKKLDQQRDGVMVECSVKL